MQALKSTQLKTYLGHNIMCRVGSKKHQLIGIRSETAIFKGFFTPHMPISVIRPCLRPTSQLMEQICHNGAIFTPYDLLKQLNKVGYHFNLSGSDMVKIILSGDLDMGKMPTWMYMKCAEWHFDVNNLLNQSLAEPLKNDQL